MFESMLDAIDAETVRALFSIDIVSKDQLEDIKQKEKKETEMILKKPDVLPTFEENN